MSWLRAGQVAAGNSLVGVVRADIGQTPVLLVVVLLLKALCL